MNNSTIYGIKDDTRLRNTISKVRVHYQIPHPIRIPDMFPPCLFLNLRNEKGPESSLAGLSVTIAFCLFNLGFFSARRSGYWADI
jgi:hypothetical protein